MKKHLTLFLIIPLLLFTSCKHTIFDDFFEIHDRIDLLKDGNDQIRERIEDVNTAIATISAIVDILSSGYYIDEVLPIIENDVEIGKQILFTNGESISVYHGVDGKDGLSPVLGVKEVDGAHYWTMNGELLLDGQGNMIPVAGDKCVLPLFDIRDGYWYLSYDGGSTWTQTGRACGEDGVDGTDGIDHLISIDDSSEDGVRFVLADGTSLFVPYFKPVRIQLGTGSDELAISGGETVTLPYTLSEEREDVRVVVSSDGIHEARLVEETGTTGYVEITCPRSYCDGFVNVAVYSGTGVTDVKVIRFYERYMHFEDGGELTIPAAGGTSRVPFEVNFDYTVRVDASCSSWLKVVDTKASTVSGAFILSYGMNQDIERTGLVHIDAVGGARSVYSFTVKQLSSRCTVGKSSFVVEAGGGTFLTDITTGYGASVAVPEESASWLEAEILGAGEVGKYMIAITVAPNASAEARSSSVSINSADGRIGLAVIPVLQKQGGTGSADEMVFTVMPGSANDSTVYLPIARWGADAATLDCFVDWGDGSFEHVTAQQKRPDSGNYVSHRYALPAGSRAYEVAVSGSVPVLCADDIPGPCRSSVVAIKQWGRTGLASMRRAFCGFDALETLPIDDSGSFAGVKSFAEAFSGCSGLKTVSEYLLQHAVEAEDFTSVFRNCSGLVKVPGDLFAACTKVTSFSGCFRGCAGLKAIPEELFMSCVKASDFSYAFMDCSGLVSLPHSLFDNNVKAVNFRGTFCNCVNVTSESVYSVIDEAKVHLYERICYPDLFVAPSGIECCYSGCSQLADWDSIPEDWKDMF